MSLPSDLSYVGQNFNLPPDVSYSNVPGFGSMGNPYSGMVYAFYGSGGYTIDQCFNSIKLITESKIYEYDVTNAIQIHYDVRTLNEKLGLFKDANNQYVTYSSYDTIRDAFTTATGANEESVLTAPTLDSITISANEFVNGLATQYVMSVGSYSTMYKDFIHYVNTYFGYAGGFGTLFSGASEFNLNNGVFDASSLMNIINPYYTASGENVKPLTGTITISNINSLLKYAINTNCFNNRSPIADLSSSDPGTTDASRYPVVYPYSSLNFRIPDQYTNVTTSGGGSGTENSYILLTIDSSFSVPLTDVSGTTYQPGTTIPNGVYFPGPYYKTNWGMADGFVDGDLIFIPAGTTVNLHLVLDSELFTPTNNVGPLNVGFNNNGTIRIGSLTYATNQETALVTTNPYYSVASGQFTQSTTATRFNIDRVLTAPLLLKLSNLSTQSGVGGFYNGTSKTLAQFHNVNYYDVNNLGQQTLAQAQAIAATRSTNDANNHAASQVSAGVFS